MAGAVLGACEVLREDGGAWAAVDASLATRAMEMLGGGLVGAAAVTFALVYFASVWFGSEPLERRRVRAAPAPYVTPAPADAGFGARHVFLAGFAAVLLAAGGYLVMASLEHPTIYGLLRGGGIGLVLMGLGGFLIWDDILAPLVRRRGA